MTDRDRSSAGPTAGHAPLSSQGRAEALFGRMPDLQARFLETIEARMTELCAVRDNLRASPDDAALIAGLEQLRFGAHRTVGVAATVGFAELGLVSQRVEVAIGDFLSRSEPPTTLRMVLALTEDMLAEMALMLAIHKP